MRTHGPQLDHLRQGVAEIFEIDRYSMVVQLRNLRREIGDAAEEMRMVAAERVFRESVCRALVKQGAKLQVTAKELTRLMRLVEKTQMPKPAARAESQTAPRQRPKRRR